MNKAIILAVGFIAGNAMAYLAFAFTAWETNPANWTSGGRALAVIIGSFAGTMSAVAAVAWETK